MPNFLPIMLLSTAQSVAYYAQYYTHNYCNYSTHFLITRLAQLGSRLLFFNFFLSCYDAVLLLLIYYAHYYAHQKTCDYVCTKLWIDYYITKLLKDCVKIFPIMLVICLMLSVIYYAQNYASIIGVGLTTYIGSISGHQLLIAQGQTHTHTDIYTKLILGNQAAAWFKNDCPLKQEICDERINYQELLKQSGRTVLAELYNYNAS